MAPLKAVQAISPGTGNGAGISRVRTLTTDAWVQRSSFNTAKQSSKLQRRTRGHPRVGGIDNHEHFGLNQPAARSIRCHSFTVEGPALEARWFFLPAQLLERWD